MAEASPTEPGFYWARYRLARLWAVVEVERTEDGGLMVYETGQWEQRQVAEFEWGPRVVQPADL